MCDDKRSDAFAWSGERFACAERMGEKSSRFSWEIMKQHLIIIHLNYDNEWLENIIALWQYRILGKTGEWMAKNHPSSRSFNRWWNGKSFSWNATNFYFLLHILNKLNWIKFQMLCIGKHWEKNTMKSRIYMFVYVSWTLYFFLLNALAEKREKKKIRTRLKQKT